MFGRFLKAVKNLGVPLKGKTVVAAVSGGADSMALLALLRQAAGPTGFKLAAAHVNHGLRGREADLDEALVRNLCRKWRVPLAVYRGHLKKGAALEERAREFRLRCLARACDKFKSRLLFLAHHQDDQAETVLFNLCRGAGLEGTSGLRATRLLPGFPKITCLRPLLGFSRTELRAGLWRNKLSWREDKSNLKTDAARNFLRHKILPLLEKKRPGTARHLAEFARRQSGFSQWARQEAARALKGIQKGSRRLNLKGLSGLPPVLQSFVLRLAASRLKGLEKGLDEPAVERLKALALKGRGNCDLLKGWRAGIRPLELTRAKPRVRFLQFYQ
jgi:tRNA(Ile)-lysidine synthase